MKDYKHILIATDAAEQSRQISERAFKLSQAFGARLSILQVLEHLPADIPVDPVPPEGVDKIFGRRSRPDRDLLNLLSGNQRRCLRDNKALKPAGQIAQLTDYFP